MTSLTSTASGLYDFSSMYFNRRLCDWICEVHKRMINIGWSNVRIVPGKYGYDVYAYSLVSIFDTIHCNKNDIFLYIGKALVYDTYLENVHNAWRSNYTYWKNVSPYTTSDKYQKPSKRLDTSVNDNYATSYCCNLPSDHIDMYLDLIKCVFDMLSETILSEGITNLKLGL